MNNRERFMAVLNGHQPDRIPVFPLLMFLAADRAGITYREYATNVENWRLSVLPWLGAPTIC